jgi:tRNA nucleotidyltransferase (CCA-adding enzyme)
MAGEQPFDATTVRERVRELPGGRELLRVAAHWDEVELVGGAVRDILIDRRAAPREFDLVVAENAHGLADALAKEFGVLAGQNPQERFESQLHDRFRTAIVGNDQVRIDIATRRRETYACPGALPDVETGTPEEDLRRRDFTVNAIAVTLDSTRPGEVRAPPGALEDLRAGRLRVLHDASFIDDPTRLLRLARYAARLGFQIEPHTSALASRALIMGALETISGARIGAELRLALSEPDATGALAAMDKLGLLTALHPRLRFDRGVIERSLVLLPDDGRPDLLTMAALTLPLALRTDDASAEILALLDRLEFTAPDRDRIAAAATAVPRLTGALSVTTRPSRLRAAVDGVPPEGVALAGGVSESSAGPARRWFAELRDISLLITGEDLLGAGIAEGPEVGCRLDAALDRKLDGELADGRDAELAAALEARV